MNSATSAGITLRATEARVEDIGRAIARVAPADLLRKLYAQVGLAPPRGILLVGPSGTGKTAMARALAGEKQLPLITIDGPQLYSKWLGESEKALREVFKKARRAAPCLLFFDTIDAVAPRSDTDRVVDDVHPRILSQLLREIDNLQDVKGVILIAATNRPERVDAALLRGGRFDYIVRFAKPPEANRAAIIRLCCARVPLADTVEVEDLARRMENPRCWRFQNSAASRVGNSAFTAAISMRSWRPSVGRSVRQQPDVKSIL